MDAKHLAFPDDAFDVIVAQYVITAVPDPEATLDEFARVLKPGGEIVLVNHIGAESGPRKAFELAFAPVARRLGWRPEFPWGRLTAWKDRTPGIHFIERRPMPPLGHFSLIRYGKERRRRACSMSRRPYRFRWDHAREAGDAMNEDAFNMSVRKFLKKVGVTAQREIEQAVRDAAASGKLKGGALPAKATFTIGGIDLTFDVTGEVETG